jgi:hypothetical protein
MSLTAFRLLVLLLLGLWIPGMSLVGWRIWVHLQHVVRA